MKLNPEELLSSIIKLKKDICAPDVIWTPSETNFPDNITIRGIPESIASGPGKLIVRHSGDTKDNMEQYLLYIPSPDKRFHFMECRTIRDMRKNGRGNRYILTRDITGEFEIYIVLPEAYVATDDERIFAAVEAFGTGAQKAQAADKTENAVQKTDKSDKDKSNDVKW